MKSKYILYDKIEEMTDKGYSYDEIRLECLRISKNFTLWWRIKQFFKGYY